MEKTQINETAKKILQETTTQMLGPSACEVLFFHLKQRLGKDPCDALLEDPATFYGEFANVFADATQITLKSFGEILSSKYGCPCSSAEFLELIHKGDEQCREKLAEMMQKIVENYKKTVS